MHWIQLVTLQGLQRSRTTLRIPTTAVFNIGHRCNATIPNVDLVARLQSDLKVALKSKDAFSATTIRSVLAEIYAAQKQCAPGTLKSSEVSSVIRKAEQRRLESMRQFQSASRPDLAEHEHKEASLLASYLPAMLPTTEVDAILRSIIAETSQKENTNKAKGLILKTFYTRVNKNAVLGDMVKQRLDELWTP